MVSPTDARASPVDILLSVSERLLTIPQSALAPLDRMDFVMEFSPCTSATEWNIIISAGPTYWLTSPEAIVEIITLGIPNGNARMAAVMMAVPPDPPAPIMPATFV